MPRFVRGALGMPKGSIRDTGGCQLFVMHSDYRPLDGRYTCYGRVTDGMDTVDKIRVGDRILQGGHRGQVNSRCLTPPTRSAGGERCGSR